MTLDPARVESARNRAKIALNLAKYFDKEAAAERAKAARLAATWGFTIKEDQCLDS